MRTKRTKTKNKLHKIKDYKTHIKYELHIIPIKNGGRVNVVASEGLAVHTPNNTLTRVIV